jgi:hypothetical protein
LEHDRAQFYNAYLCGHYGCRSDYGGGDGKAQRSVVFSARAAAVGWGDGM